jgi:hypothetical protein
MKETELLVQKIINLQNIVNNLPDAFTNYKVFTKSWNSMESTLVSQSGNQVLHRAALVTSLMLSESYLDGVNRQ